MSRAYWDGVRSAGCNAIGGTSYFYEVLDRLDLDSLDVPRLTKFGHSGSRLSEHLIRKFHGAIARRGGTLHLMYGQAETTARISGLPPELLPEAGRSVGFAVPGGQVRVERDSVECGPMEEGELLYSGPNVMMGYATSAQDLALGDTQGEVRETGDIGYKDERGLIYITGRKARLVKLFGWRISLDEVEDLLAPAGPVAAVNEQERVAIYAECASAALHQAVRDLVARMNLHPSGFQVRSIGVLPRLANGKVDYKSLASESASAAWAPAASSSAAD
jgi:acyl-coenzyme A synthetase/AMP-(fatty) acid ligase